MNHLYRRYRAQLRDQLGFWATWLPDAMISIGDILEEDKKTRLPTRVRNLKDVGVSFVVEEKAGAKSVKYVSENTKLTSNATNVDASVPNAKSDLDISLSFADSGSVVFLAEKCKEISIGDLTSVGSNLIRLHKNGEWDREWLVVTSVVEVANATVIISNTSNAEISFEIKGEASIQNVDFGTVANATNIKQRQGIGFDMVASKMATPLFLVHKVSKNPFVPAKLKSKRFQDSGQISEQSEYFFEAIEP